jgi:hypothetical protein
MPRRESRWDTQIGAVRGIPMSYAVDGKRQSPLLLGLRCSSLRCNAGYNIQNAAICIAFAFCLLNYEYQRA